jgi:hypothetical protein
MAQLCSFIYSYFEHRGLFVFLRNRMTIFAPFVALEKAVRGLEIGVNYIPYSSHCFIFTMARTV